MKLPTTKTLVEKCAQIFSAWLVKIRIYRDEPILENKEDYILDVPTTIRIGVTG